MSEAMRVENRQSFLRQRGGVSGRSIKIPPSKRTRLLRVESRQSAFGRSDGISGRLFIEGATAATRLPEADVGVA